ncbi:MAG: GAF domain-containing sensor histidine kinase [Mycobacterium sp.]
MERRGDLRWPVRVATAIAVVLMLLSVSFLVWRATNPGQCAQLYPAADQWTESGVLPDVTAGCPLSAGELVTAAERQPSGVLLMVISDGSTGAVTLPLIPSDLAGRFRDAWSTMLFTISLFGVACYAFARRRAAPAAGALLVLSSGLLGSSAVTVVGLPVGDAFSGWPLWLFLANVVVSYQFAWGGLLCLASVFPTEPVILRSRPARRVAILFGPLTAVALAALTLGFAQPLGGFGSPGWIHGIIVGQSVITVLSLLGGVGILVGRAVRLHRTGVDSIERQQLLWIGGSGAAATLLVLALWMVPQLFTGASLLPQDAIGLPGLIFVAGLTVALLRYRVFDLELLLGRTMVYPALTLVVVVIYLGVVGLIAAVFSGSAATPTAVAGAVVVAIAVNPLRILLQRSVNRLLYGDRDDPYAAMSRVAEQLTAAARRRVVLPAVATDVRKAMRVPYVSIQWQVEDELAVAEVGVRPTPDDCYDLPLMYRGENVGRFVVGTRGRGVRFTPAERRLLSDLSRQVAAAAHEIQLSAELQQSRERLVLAREEERRVIRRTLHDDIGPTIASIGLRAETVRRLADRPADADRMSTALTSIGQDATLAAAALRELSYELRPPALDDRGLVMALQDRVAGYAPLEVSVVTTGFDTRHELPAAVEVAAFRIALGGLSNVARHAGARMCWVRLMRSDRQLIIEIDDDGMGLPTDFRAGVGVTAMRERAGELGGECVFDLRAEGGTAVRARIPIGIDR